MPNLSPAEYQIHLIREEHRRKQKLALTSQGDEELAREAKLKHDLDLSSKVPNAEPAQQAGALGSDHEGKAPGAVLPLVRFELCRVKLLDIDAKYGSIKDLLDGLTTAGLIPGDREDQIRLEVVQRRVWHFKDEATVIQITHL